MVEKYMSTISQMSSANDFSHVVVLLIAQSLFLHYGTRDVTCLFLFNLMFTVIWGDKFPHDGLKHSFVSSASSILLCLFLAGKQKWLKCKLPLILWCFFWPFWRVDWLEYSITKVIRFRFIIGSNMIEPALTPLYIPSSTDRYSKSETSQSFPKLPLHTWIYQPIF